LRPSRLNRGGNSFQCVIGIVQIRISARGLDWLSVPDHPHSNLRLFGTIWLRGKGMSNAELFQLMNDDQGAKYDASAAQGIFQPGGAMILLKKIS
jgi:hypothetical protein